MYIYRFNAQCSKFISPLHQWEASDFPKHIQLVPKHWFLIIWVTRTEILAKSSVWGPVEGQQLNDSSFAIGPQPFQWEWNMKVDSVTNTAPETISKYCSRNDKLKAQIDLNGNFGGVWVNLKWKEEHQCGAKGTWGLTIVFRTSGDPKNHFWGHYFFCIRSQRVAATVSLFVKSGVK